MDLLWPGFLVLLGLIPVLVVAYILILRRRKKYVVRYSSLSLVKDSLPRHSSIRRHLPFALFLIAVACLMMAMTRPVAILTVPTNQTTVIMAIDSSRSMCSTDVAPTRLEAAKSAALSFIKNQNSRTQIGIVVFSGFAAIVQQPTTDQNLLETAIQRIDVANRTAIGSAIEKAIDAIAEIDPKVSPSLTGSTTGIVPTPVPKGAYVPAIIVLLTDGVSNVGTLPMDAAQEAADRGIRVFTIGFGTDSNQSFSNCGRQVGFGNRNQFGNGGGGPFGGQFGGGGFRRGIDDVTLKQVAALTGGSYYPASTASELQKVFESLPLNLVIQHETTEISVVFTAIGAFLVLLAILLSFAWHPLP